jgi:hypothetical protein
MKKYILLILISVLTINFSFAQKERASPKESISGKINLVAITIKYGAPSVKGREIWGGLVPFDKIWRAGANEATTFEFEQELLVENLKLPAGKYSFFIIPNEKNCTIIFNKVFDQWGAYKYNIEKDQLRVNVKPEITPEQTEKLVYLINENSISLKWSNWAIILDVR